VGDNGTGDEFTESTEVIANITVHAGWTADPCGGLSSLTDSRDSKIYSIVSIGEQCWMQQNLNVGVRVAGTSNQGTSCSSIEKYCYDNNESNCTTYGGFYQWDQAMCGGTTPGATGICPAGWHIPTDEEFTTLERAVCTSGTCESDFPYVSVITTAWRGTNEGTTLKSGSGFNGLISGLRYTDGSFMFSGSYAGWWSSTLYSGLAWERWLYSGWTTIWRGTNDNTYGLSIRCLKN